MEQSKSQVEQALGRLEAALEAVAKRETELSRSLAAARQEAAELRQENAALKGLVAEASARLEKTIERVQTLLSGKAH